MSLRPSGFFILCAPLLPLDELLGLDRERLCALVARPEVREALRLSSSALDRSIDGWLADPSSSPSVERALTRYLARMAGRPTPFGLCAGWSVGEMGAATHLAIAPRAEWRRHSRLDGDRLIERCESAPRTLRANPSGRHAAGRLVIERAQLGLKRRATSALAIEPSDPIVRTLARAAGGATPESLGSALVADDPEITPAEASGFVAELAAAGLLEPRVTLACTGDDPIAELEQALNAEAHPAAVEIARARATLATIDRAGPSGLAARREDYLDGGPLLADPASSVRVELSRPSCGATIGRAVLDEIARGAALLSRLDRPADRLAPLTAAFAERWGDEEVPLARVLDEEAGLGIDHLPRLEEPPPAQGLLPLVERAWREGRRSVDLAAILPALPAAAPLPPSFVVRCAVGAESEEALAHGRFRVRLDALEAPATEWLARFAASDRELAARLAAHLREEERRRPDAVHAEVIHFSDGPRGRIELRPLLRDFEIPYLARSGAAPDRQLALDDLTVALVDEKLALRSRRLGREVVPCFSSGARGAMPPIAALLRAFAHVERRAFRWGALEEAAFLPRVELSRLVLARARWRLDRAELARLDGAASLARLREALGLSRVVELVEGERRLPFDLDSALCRDALAQRLRKKPSALLAESLPDPTELCARGEGGRFVHQLVVPFLDDAPAQASRPLSSRPTTSARRFAPGAEWLQLKVYAAQVTADRTLVELLAPVLSSALARGAINRWYFYRTHDSDWHLRLRLHGPRPLDDPFPQLYRATAPFRDDGRLRGPELDTYAREVERYGGLDGVAIAERIFHADSEAVVGLVALDAGAALPHLALRGVDQLFDDLGLDAAAKLAVLEGARARHFPVDAALGRALGPKLRAESAALASLLDRAGDAASPFGPALAVLDQRSAAIAPLLVELRALETAGKLSRSIADQAASFAHMFVNRLLRPPSLEAERALYHALGRLYRSARV